MIPIVLASGDSYTWLSSLPFLHGENAKYLPLAHSYLAVAILLVLAVIARMALMRAPATREALIPEANLKPKNLFELYTEAILNMVRGVLGKEDGDFYFPLIAALFAYIFVNNSLGLLPGFAPPTGLVNTNIPMALSVFVIYNVAGVIRQGPKDYFKHFMGPVLWLAPLMVAVEIISHLSRPLSLSVRLYGNISGDHLVLDIFLNQLPEALFPLLGWGLPIVFLALGLFVCFIQAFVFSLLSMLYIALAVAHDH